MAGTQQSYIPGLDGIRALSVLVVMIGHFGLGHIVPGGLGVTVFFTISGFLITTLLLEEYERTAKIAVGAFYLRRLLRLMPELLGLILFSGLIGLAIGNGPSLTDVLSALFYATNYLSIYQQYLTLGGGTGFEIYWPQLWSLAVEEHYYLTFPLMLSLLVSRPRTIWALVIGMIIASLALRLVWVHGGFELARTQYPYPYLATETRIDSIAYGALFALFRHRALKTGYRPGALATYAALAAGLALLAFSLLWRDAQFRETFRYSVQGVAVFLIFFHLYMGAPSPFEALLEWKPMRMMGVLSYGAYLWHLEIPRVSAKLFPGAEFKGLSLALYIGVATALTFAIAWVSYRLLARPVAGLRRRFGSHSV
ncbi:MAG: acyltransferase [Proteobacteria bacterium]|nr:acyltransferase [Pseudomonadota bacterium]